jgi:hypothetical protein
MVDANAPKELQNVLPKCNPFAFHIEYNSGWSDPIWICRWQALSLHPSVQLNIVFGDLGGGSPLCQIRQHCYHLQPLIAEENFQLA